MNNLPIVAAIPNYNMAESLRILLPEVIEQGYDRIYVMDDASTDHSRDVIRSFGNRVTLMSGSENLGGGGNRNRIMDALVTTSLIHFLDADVTIETPDMPTVIRSLNVDDTIGFVGGLVHDSDGEQSIWNYGPKQSIQSSVGSSVLSLFGDEGHRGTTIGRSGISLLAPLYQHRPIPGEQPVRQPVFWTLESNLVIRSDTFKQLGGFDTRINEHDIQSLAYQSQQRGLVNIFDPSFAVTHNNVHVRQYNRAIARMSAEFYLTRKFGVLQWLMPGTINQPK
jgi:GT2 family glycosyltransferase